MKFLTNYNTLKDKSVGLMLFDEKSNLDNLTLNQAKAPEYLQDKCDVIVVDILNFNLVAFAKHLRMYIPTLSDAVYKKYFKNIDYAVRQSPRDQIKRINSLPNLGKIKYRIKRMCKFYPVKYENNRQVLAGYLLAYEIYHSLGLKIKKAVNTWACGYRSFLVQNYVQRFLDIDMDVIAPLKNENGVVCYYTEGALDPDIEKEMADINNQIQTVEEFKKFESKFIEDKYFFYDPRYAPGAMGEVIVNIYGVKTRMVNYYEHV